LYFIFSAQQLQLFPPFSPASTCRRLEAPRWNKNYDRFTCWRNWHFYLLPPAETVGDDYFYASPLTFHEADWVWGVDGVC
jgi:hypothetical protein